MAEELKNKIVGPLDFMVPGFMIAGINFPIVADLPEGGFLQIVEGENPMTPPTPSVTLPKGVMIALIDPAVAAQIRPGLRQHEKDSLKALQNPTGAILHPNFAKEG